MNKNVWLNLDTIKDYLITVSVDGYAPRYTDLYRQFHKTFSENVRRFGGYGHIVKELGLNIKNFYKASDGHLLSSYYEYLFDEYLYLNNIPHETEGFICSGISRCRYDFKINDVFVEIWGIKDVKSKAYKNYCKKRKIKESLYKSLKYKLISIDGKDFCKSSSDLQSLFKNKLSIFGICSSDNQINYPIFNRRKIGYWNEITVKEELQKVIKQIGYFPTYSELSALNRDDLGSAVRSFGGCRKYARILGFKPRTKKYCVENVINEIKIIKEKIGHFPSDNELQKMNNHSLASFIRNYGGYGYFKLLINGHRDKMPFGYWNNEENIVNELKALNENLGREPKYRELGSIAKGIDKSGKGMKYFMDKVYE